MVGQKIRVVSETLARTMDRRGFLRRTGTTVVGGLMALAAGQALGGTSSARYIRQPKFPAVPSCTPPGPYCNLDGNGQDPNGCHGARCFQHLSGGTVYACRVYYTYYPQGCWTRAIDGGYWTCCDCECGGGGTCGCAQFSLDPQPNPD